MYIKIPDNGVYTKAIKDNHSNVIGMVEINLSHLEVDAVEVVRCKNCNKWKRNETYCIIGYCSLDKRNTSEDWYCAAGRRKLK